MDIKNYLIDRVKEVLAIENVYVQDAGVFTGVYATRNFIYLCLDTSQQENGELIPGLDIFDSDIEQYTHKFRTEDLYLLPAFTLYLGILKSSTFAAMKTIQNKLCEAVLDKMNSKFKSSFYDKDRNIIEIFCVYECIYLNTDKYFKKGIAEPSIFPDFRYVYSKEKISYFSDIYILIYILEA